MTGIGSGASVNGGAHRPDRRRSGRRRGLAIAAAAAVIAAGLVVHGALPDTAATDIAGDALYAVLIYLLVVAVAPRASAPVAAAVASGWCVAVELLQLTDLPGHAASVFPPAVLVLGTVFDPRDLVIYVVAVAITAGADVAMRRASIRRRGGSGAPPLPRR
ncbi:MAG: DUF2809 domain-containing protein [Microbacterium arborescens]